MTRRRRPLFACACKQKEEKKKERGGWRSGGRCGRGRSVRQGEREAAESEGGREGWRETSPLLSLRWDFYGWVSLVRATKHIKSHFQFVAGS